MYCFMPTNEQKAKDEKQFGKYTDMICPNCGLETSYWSEMNAKCWECQTILIKMQD